MDGLMHDVVEQYERLGPLNPNYIPLRPTYSRTDGSKPKFLGRHRVVSS